MVLFKHELKKLLSMAALWVFIALCIAFNIMSIPRGLRRIEFDTTSLFPYNVFENHNTSEIAEGYISMLNLTGRVAERMQAKYAAMQPIADERAIFGDSFSPYFGEHTQIMHISLFHGVAGVMGRLLLQGILLVVLLTLLAVGYEQINNTEHVVYATKIGRRILFNKIVACIVAGIGAYIILAAITLAVYFNMFGFRDVWGSSVSSGFNYIASITGARPFITWHNLTVASYFIASIGLALGLQICFIFMSVIVGTLSKNVHIGFLMMVLVNAVCFALPLVIPRTLYAHFVPFHTPIWLWWNSHLWFTDGSMITLWRNFELWGLGVSFIALAAFCVLAARKFEKRNIA